MKSKLRMQQYTVQQANLKLTFQTTGLAKIEQFISFKSLKI